MNANCHCRPLPCVYSSCLGKTCIPTLLSAFWYPQLNTLANGKRLYLYLHVLRYLSIYFLFPLFSCSLTVPSLLWPLIHALVQFAESLSKNSHQPTSPHIIAISYLVRIVLFLYIIPSSFVPPSLSLSSFFPSSSSNQSHIYPHPRHPHKPQRNLPHAQIFLTRHFHSHHLLTSQNHVGTTSDGSLQARRAYPP